MAYLLKGPFVWKSKELQISTLVPPLACRERKKAQHSNNTFISHYLPLLGKAFSSFLSRLPRARRIGPWAKEYRSPVM